MHYAVPRILENCGQLSMLYTDLCAAKGAPQLLRLIPQALRPRAVTKILNRVPKGVSPRRITAFNRFGLDYARRLAASTTSHQRDEAYLWAGREFGQNVLGKGFGEARMVYGFNSASSEIFAAAKKEGMHTVLEQTICPRYIEEDLLGEERERFPDWGEGDSSELAKEFADRERSEWANADTILCASEFVRDGVVACGGDPNKCKIVPYGVDHLDQAVSHHRRGDRPLRVLTAGSVGLRKGTPYTLEAAKRLKGRVEFRIVGIHHASEQAITELQKYVDAPGAVPRSEMINQYQWADVYLLPSLCEGSATSTYEAMSHGLPIVCTPNTGSVVRNGIEGFVAPIRSTDAIVEALESLMNDPDLLESMSQASAQRAKQFTLDGYSNNLRAALGLDQPKA